MTACRDRARCSLPAMIVMMVIVLGLGGTLTYGRYRTPLALYWGMRMKALPVRLPIIALPMRQHHNITSRIPAGLIILPLALVHSVRSPSILIFRIGHHRHSRCFNIAALYPRHQRHHRRHRKRYPPVAQTMKRRAGWTHHPILASRRRSSRRLSGNPLARRPPTWQHLIQCERKAHAPRRNRH